MGLPVNNLHRALKKIADNQPRAFIDRYPKPEGETNQQFHERMRAIARAAFRMPEDQPDNSVEYDGDMGREHEDHLRDNGAIR